MDQTGLIGKFDFALVFELNPVEWHVTNAQPESYGLTLEEAAEKQLGLKLKPTKAIVDILVVDRVAMPSEN